MKLLLGELARTLPPIAGQFAGELQFSLSDRLDIPHAERRQAIDFAKLQPQPSGEFETEQSRQAYYQTFRINQLAELTFLAQGNLIASRDAVAEMKLLGTAIEPATFQRDTAFAVEQLFFSAYSANRDVFSEAFLKPSGSMLGLPASELEERLAQVDELLVEYRKAEAKTNALHNLCRRQGDKVVVHALSLNRERSTAPSDLHVISAIATHIDTVVLSSALSVRWTELDPKFDESQQIVDYRRSEFLGHLLRQSRSRVLTNIAGCHARSIPCPAAIGAFQIAESYRDRRDADLVDHVLVNYWKASLQAQALSMVFNVPRDSP